MNSKVQEFIQLKNEEYETRKRTEYEKKKVATLEDLGFVEKEYAPNGAYSDEYSKCEYDEEGNRLYYREVAINISDEDFEALQKCLDETEDEKREIREERHSTIANILWVFAWIMYIGGFIAGFIFGVDKWGNPNASVLVYWVAFFAAGTLYASIAEIINLLCDIRNRMK